MIFMVNSSSSIPERLLTARPTHGAKQGTSEGLYLAAILCAYWNIVDLSHSLPVQLRHRGSKQVEPTVFERFLEFCKTPK
jgi:hypothetical protein